MSEIRILNLCHKKSILVDIYRQSLLTIIVNSLLTDTSIKKDTLLKQTPRVGPSLFYSLLLTLSNECLSKTDT